jgi:hypothetical protein
MSTTPAPRARPRELALRKALSSSPRPPRPSALSAGLTFGWRGMLKVKHVPEQLLDATVTPVLFTRMFTYLFGGAIAGSTREYLQFLLPGILVMSVLFTTVYSGVSLNTDMTKGVVDRFRSLPIWRPAPLVGAVLGDSVRYLVAAAVVVALGMALGFRPGGRGRRRARGDGAGGRVLLRPGLGVHDRRAADAHAQRRHERRLHGPVPADLPEQRLRRAGDPPGVARGIRRRQSDLPPW